MGFDEKIYETRGGKEKMNIQTRIVNALCSIEEFLIFVRIDKEVHSSPSPFKLWLFDYF